MTPVVRLHQATKAYSGRVTLRSTDLSVGPGEIIGVCGASGAGKSTLLRLIGAIERPDSGTIEFAGRSVWEGRRRVHHRNGYVTPVFQYPASSLDPRWPIWRSLTEPLWDERLDRGSRRRIALEAIESVGLDGVDLQARPHELSGGECQRVAILRAIIAGPKLLIADEPTSALDVTTGRLIRELLRRAAHDGTSIVIASHDVAALASMSDRMFAVCDGDVTPWFGSGARSATPSRTPASSSRREHREGR